MLYQHHGINVGFSGGYHEYFGPQVGGGCLAACAAGGVCLCVGASTWASAGVPRVLRAAGGTYVWIAGGHAVFWSWSVPAHKRRAHPAAPHACYRPSPQPPHPPSPHPRQADVDACVYLMMANELVHSIHPDVSRFCLHCLLHAARVLRMDCMKVTGLHAPRGGAPLAPPREPAHGPDCDTAATAPRRLTGNPHPRTPPPRRR